MELRRGLRSGNGLLPQSFQFSERHARISCIQGSATERGGFDRDATPKRQDRNRHCQQPGFRNTEESQAFFS
jgi:hypothetical protein